MMDENNIEKKLDQFTTNWNNKDLNALAERIAININLQTPPVKMGPFALAGRSLHGKHEVLKFWKYLFENFSFGFEDTTIISIKNNTVTSLIRYHKLGLEARCTWKYNQKGEIADLSFDTVHMLGKTKEAKALPMMLRLFKDRMALKFGI